MISAQRENTLEKTQIVAEPGSQNITITREFNAPVELVYRAYTEPDLVAQWLGPRGYQTTVETLDLRHGGGYRFLHNDPSGASFAFRGIFHGDPGIENGMMRTFEFEGMPGHVALEVITFESLGERSRIHGLSTF